MILGTNDIEKICELLTSGHIGVMPTDTIYGLHCLANSTDLINKIYTIKDRPKNMPFITLISSTKGLNDFEILPTEFQKETMNKLWPGPNSLIFTDVSGQTRSFRLPNNEFLLNILSVTGPLISTSVNKHGYNNAKNIEEAYFNFKDKVDFFVDAGTLSNPPSNVYSLVDDAIKQLR